MGNENLLPKNIRQIGEIQGRRKIYLEDYVMTYIRKMEDRGSEDFLGVLLGERRYTEDAEYVFARGIMEIPGESDGRDGEKPKQEIRGESDASRIAEADEKKTSQIGRANSGSKRDAKKESAGEKTPEKEKTGLWQAFQKRYGTQEEWTSEEAVYSRKQKDRKINAAEVSEKSAADNIKNGDKADLQEIVKDASGIPEDRWERFRREREEYFPGYQVVGCCVIGTWAAARMEELTQQIPEAKQMLYHLQDQEERLYWLEGERYEGVGGYFVFYEQNRQMQEYLSELFGGKSVEKESAPDKAIISFREKVKEKANEKSRSFLKLASSFFVVGALLVGVIAVNRVSDLRQAATVSTGTSTASVEDGQSTVMDSEDAALNASGSNVSGNASEATENAENAEDAESTENAENAESTESIENEKNAEDAGSTESAESAEAAAAEDSAAALAETESAAAASSEAADALTGSDAFWADDETADAAAVSETSETSETAAAVAASSRQVQASYIIRTGDTLAEICAKYYGSLDRLEELCEANGIEDADLIIPGQKIVLP